MNDWIHKLLGDPDMLQMGHGQSASDVSLGLGWVYYGIARALRPRRAVVIGSWRGFVPLILGRALAENGAGGEVVFIDPSMVDGFWREPGKVGQHFSRFGIENIRHFRQTTQEFAASPEFEAIGDVGLLFIDGLHTFDQARFDYDTFAPKLNEGAIVFFHDSIKVRISKIYGEDHPYEHRVKDLMDLMREDPDLELFDLPLDAGVTLMRRRSEPR